MSQHAKRLLVVDDDTDICSNLRDILEDQGYRIDVAHDGDTALGFVNQHHYDLVLLDFIMPGMDGAELYGKIRQLAPSIPAIMITAFAANEGLQRARRAGTWQIITKPVDPRELLTLVSAA